MTTTASIDPVLIKKYDQAVPRYTSYPTIPFWQNNINASEWQERFMKQFSMQNPAHGISLYLHLPFCESLCTYCGCNKKIARPGSVEEPYLQALEKEWLMYRKQMDQAPVIREIHLGGGTPTFFTPRHLERLLRMLTRNSVVHPYRQFSIEGHPNNTTRAHLNALHALGFRRISYGVQDLDPEVQHIINRIQPFGNVSRATDEARAAGFTSVNFDLIYGLPRQTIRGMDETIRQVLLLKPDRLALYSYAHVPWTSKAQRLFQESDLPGAADKLAIYLHCREQLLSNGYFDIGMDHFALAHDELYTAKQNGRLHRNFMGYTTQQTAVVLGLGMSAISDTGDAYAQNTKTLHDYYEAVDAGRLPIQRGHVLSTEDRVFRRYIQDIACKGETIFEQADLPLLQQYCFPILASAAHDGLVNFDQNLLELTGKGWYFLRNICAAFDIHLQRSQGLRTDDMFSKAV